MKEAIQKIIDLGYSLREVNTDIKCIEFKKILSSEKSLVHVISCRDYRLDEDINDWLISSYIEKTNAFSDYHRDPFDLDLETMSLLVDLCNEVNWEELKRKAKMKYIMLQLAIGKIGEAGWRLIRFDEAGRQIEFERGDGYARIKPDLVEAQWVKEAITKSDIDLFNYMSKYLKKYFGEEVE